MNFKTLLMLCVFVTLATGNTTEDTSDDETHCPPDPCFSRECNDILVKDRSALSGEYIIQPVDGGSEFRVYCDMREDGAWTVIQRRHNGLVNFYRGWEDYKEGFGSIYTDFWLGNEKINRITFDGDYKLLIEIMDHDNIKKHARYSHFRVGTEWSNYTMIINGYNGTAGDSMEAHTNKPFSTFDRDNDDDSTNCAERFNAGWWYTDCLHSSLNGPYQATGPTTNHMGVIWDQYKGNNYSHKWSVMMLKRNKFPCFNCNYDGPIGISIYSGCEEILKQDPLAVSGVYVIQPNNSSEFSVYCKMREGEAWTVIQRRFNGSVNFTRGWEEYKEGFGDLNTELWLGNDKIHSITSDGDFEVLFEITDHDDIMKYARYSHFEVGNEHSNYLLEINGYSGTAGDSMSYHNNQAFSTFDRDNDVSGSNCAIVYKAAWWYKSCFHASLNGPYQSTVTPGNLGIIWHGYKNSYSFKKSVILVKKVVN